MTFWNFSYFRKILLDQSLWVFNRVRWWCHTLTILKLLKISFTENDKNFIFMWAKVNLSCIPKINENLCLFRHISIQGYTFTCICPKNIFHNFIMMCVVNCEIIIHHFTQMNIHRNWSRNVFWKHGTIEKIHLSSLFLLLFS